MVDIKEMIEDIRVEVVIKRRDRMKEKEEINKRMKSIEMKLAGLGGRVEKGGGDD